MASGNLSATGVSLIFAVVFAPDGIVTDTRSCGVRIEPVMSGATGAAAGAATGAKLSGVVELAAPRQVQRELQQESQASEGLK